MTDIVDPASVAEAVADVRARIDALSGGRDVQLVAVTKGFGADAISAAIAAGCTAVGENYAQELQQKLTDLDDVPAASARPEIHFIGHVQTNKVRLLAPLVDVWQTVDRDSLIDELVRRVPGARVFVQVNTTDETSKAGCAPPATEALVDRGRTAGLLVEGLMTIGPTSTDPTQTAAAFAELRALADRLGLAGCSMGMSGDYDIAIANGATHIRIGSALFGQRPHRRAPIG